MASEFKVLSLGYWRKHPDLHGFIVKTFANGKDECQRIDLTGEDLIKIIEAVKSNTLQKGSFLVAVKLPTNKIQLNNLKKL